MSGATAWPDSEKVQTLSAQIGWSHHQALLAASEGHRGMIFTHGATMPRTKLAIPQWVLVLTQCLIQYAHEGSLRNRIHHLP